MNLISYTLLLALLGYPISAVVVRQDDVRMGSIRVQPRSLGHPAPVLKPEDKGVLCEQNRFYSREHLSGAAAKALEEKESCRARNVFCMFPMAFAAYEYPTPVLPSIYPVLSDGTIYENNSYLQGNHDRVVLTATGQVLGATTSKPLEDGTGNYYAPCAVVA
ncbi:BgTH12-07765 [Blumeria graminis f. sp. triticale]|uniref:BgtAcSP-30748 n=3 Tax=Blumeria graminis TaxID=34373 RepID=A0A9X9MPZ8_BLUGR|nr:hypothetical protein BGT96224_AcSP30748 [Blumeria graminis f. sp. tritici 96224]CAD6506538.1 BgTH12-07765 [Blumeria graminis f. sp. triticale]VDB96392.1 BgtAcSP-30748 [Blumeria graminis f. sp. tritici]